MHKRWFKIGLLILIILFVLPPVFLLSEHVRGWVSLSHYKRLLITKGEKLTVHDLASPSPQGENGAPEKV